MFQWQALTLHAESRLRLKNLHFRWGLLQDILILIAQDQHSLVLLRKLVDLYSKEQSKRLSLSFLNE